MTSTSSRTAIGYARTAPASDASELDAQRGGIAAECGRRGWELAAVHGDGGAGRTADPHAGLDAALEGVCRQRGVLVVDSLAALARSALACIRLCARLDQAGADLVSLREGIDTTRDGRALFKLMAALGDLELERYRLARQAPFGFDLTDDGEHLVLKPAEQAIIRRIVLAYRNGSGYDAIARELSDDQIAPPLGSQHWDAAAVKGIIDHVHTSRWVFDE